MSKVKDLTGRKFGMLLVLNQVESKNGKAYWSCVCDCGDTTIVSGSNLRTGAVKSCGCLQGKKDTHHLSRTRLFRVWYAIKQRCYNKNHSAYKYYGEKNITMYSEWKDDFVCFYEWAKNNGYKDDLTIDRIDNNKGYFPDNCRFVSRKVQANNRNFCRQITYKEKTQNLTQWCEELQLDYKLIHSRITKLNWTFEKAISTPVITKKRKET